MLFQQGPLVDQQFVVPGKQPLHLLAGPFCLRLSGHKIAGPTSEPGGGFHPTVDESSRSLPAQRDSVRPSAVNGSQSANGSLWRRATALEVAPQSESEPFGIAAPAAG